MAKKIDIKAIHENFHTLLNQRNELKSTNQDKKTINKIDVELNRIIVNGIIQGIAFSPQIYKLIKSTQQAIVNHIKYRLIVHNTNLI